MSTLGISHEELSSRIQGIQELTREVCSSENSPHGEGSEKSFHENMGLEELNPQVENSPSQEETQSFNNIPPVMSLEESCLVSQNFTDVRGKSIQSQSTSPMASNPSFMPNAPPPLFSSTDNPGSLSTASQLPPTYHQQENVPPPYFQGVSSSAPPPYPFSTSGHNQSLSENIQDIPPVPKEQSSLSAHQIKSPISLNRHIESQYSQTQDSDDEVRLEKGKEKRKKKHKKHQHMKEEWRYTKNDIEDEMESTNMELLQARYELKKLHEHMEEMSTNWLNERNFFLAERDGIIEDATSELRLLENQIITIKASKEKLVQQVETLQIRNTEIENLKSKYEQQVDLLKDLNADLKQQLLHKKPTDMVLGSPRSAKVDQGNEEHLSSLLEEERRKCAALEAELAKKITGKENDGSVENSLRMEIDNLKMKNDDLLDECRELKAQVKKLDRMNNDKASDVEAIQREMAKTKQQYEMLKEDKNNADVKLFNTISSLSDAQKDNQKLKKELEEYAYEARELKKQIASLRNSKNNVSNVFHEGGLSPVRTSASVYSGDPPLTPGLPNSSVARGGASDGGFTINPLTGAAVSYPQYGQTEVQGMSNGLSGSNSAPMNTRTSIGLTLPASAPVATTSSEYGGHSVGTAAGQTTAFYTGSVSGTDISPKRVSSILLTPYGTENQKEVEEKLQKTLLDFSIERDMIIAKLNKYPSNTMGRTLHERREKMILEERLNEANVEISKLRQQLRTFGRLK